MAEFFFNPDFLNRVRQTAKMYSLKERALSRHQWEIARMVNEEWKRVDAKYQGEINKLYFLAAASVEINAGLPFPICSTSGETLRRWCEVAASYENMDTTMFESVLSFDHFRVARALAKLPQNERDGVTPYDILLRCVQEEWTVGEMMAHFGPNPLDVTEYERAVGWLDSLQAARFEWVKDRSDRAALKDHAAGMRRILEKYA